jgi:phosphopantothenoylcysteine decarboxylase/phosphopantothenate--cysteine ligase
MMKCIVTAGPTYEPLDEVRRLTNFSTGQLGTELANYLQAQGHEVILLLGHYATWPGPRQTQRLEHFTTTATLSERLEALAAEPIDAVFHAAAVSDFGVGRLYERTANDTLVEIRSAKIPTRQGPVLAELVPIPKVIVRLRAWYAQSLLVGWKYELVGDRTEALAQAARQIADCRTDYCVLNGRAYGTGFGVVAAAGQYAHCPAREDLFTRLAQILAARSP